MGFEIKVPEKSPEEMIRLADELDALQKDKNDGRGVSCVKQVITYLRLGKIVEARQICFVDHDKMEQYPDIFQHLIDNELLQQVKIVDRDSYI